MDITKFVVQGRDQALLYGDYSTYHSQLTRRLLASRRKLGIATKNRGKYQKRPDITAQDVAQNSEYIYLLLLTSERAWAQAMTFKTTHKDDEQGLVGRARSHVVSRLHKAVTTTDLLVKLLAHPASSATPHDLLEAKSYNALMKGSMYFEKQTWKASLAEFATARVAYTALSVSTKGDFFKDLLSETIDPSIRYAAYQLKTPRTVPITSIVLQEFPGTDEALIKQVNAADKTILNPAPTASEGGSATADATPKTLSWRSRQVTIEDAQIAEAWGQVQGAKSRLAEKASKLGQCSPREMAAAYEEVLMITQDAVDATKQAIDELRGEGVGSGDARMQSLQITRTAVNYEMISWRIGRNRVLTGPHDGATEETVRTGKKRKQGNSEVASSRPKELSISKKLAKLREKTALYDGILQNFVSIQELPGVANDEALAGTLHAYQRYFDSLKSLSIARSHAIVGKVANALALIHHAAKLCAEASASNAQASPAESQPAMNVIVGAEEVAFLSKLLDGELQRHRAIVHIDNLRQEAQRAAGKPKNAKPLIERLGEYPVGGVDLKNIVQYPPKMELIPIKPLFLDVAWNYIDYPGKTTDSGKAQSGAASATASAQKAQEEKPSQPTKRGWFGFGRS